jgi:phosphate:Na+ symporter
LGDSGETISRILSRKNIHKKVFDADTIKNLNTMADALDEAYDAMIANLIAAHKGELVNISNAYNAEGRLNTLRNNFRDVVIEEIDNGGKNYQTSVYYMDIINEYERMGDFMINVSQDLEKVYVHK